MYIDPKEIEVLNDFDHLKDFSKRIADGLNDIFIDALKLYGFDKDYIEKNNSEFHIEVWPREEIGFGTEEQFSNTQYDIYHKEDKLFTVDVIIKMIFSDGEYRLEVQYETRKWKDLK